MSGKEAQDSDYELLHRSFEGLIYDTMSEYRHDIDVLSTHLEIEPLNAHALNNRGVALMEIGMDGDALADFDRAIATGCAAAAVWANRGRLRGRLGDWVGAADDFAHAIVLEPSATVFIERGRAYRHMGMLPEALADFDQAMSLGARIDDERAGLRHELGNER